MGTPVFTFSLPGGGAIRPCSYATPCGPCIPVVFPGERVCAIGDWDLHSHSNLGAAVVKLALNLIANLSSALRASYIDLRISWMLFRLLLFIFNCSCNFSHETASCFSPQWPVRRVRPERRGEPRQADRHENGDKRPPHRRSTLENQQDQKPGDLGNERD